jgi:hypothetical protein
VALTLGEPIASFNIANSDSSQTPVQHEVVSMIGAFERLVDSPSGKERDLVGPLVELVAPYLSTTRKCKRLASINRFEASHGAGTVSASITEAWIRDFFHVRNAFGHGRRTPDRPTYWTPEAHLLFGAYLFPLAVLIRLGAAGFYRMSSHDTDCLLAFPYFVSLRKPLARRRNPAAQKPYLWKHALELASREVLRAQIAAAWEQQAGAKPF